MYLTAKYSIPFCRLSHSAAHYRRKLYCREKEQHVNWVSNNGKTYDASQIYFPHPNFNMTFNVLTAVNIRITFLRVAW